MKTIRNLTKQEVILEGFGAIEIKEQLDGEWLVDFYPHGFDNNEEKMSVNMCRSGAKFFENLENLRKRHEKRIDEIYES